MSVPSPRRLGWSLVPVSLVVLLACLWYTLIYVFAAPYPGLTLNNGWVVIQIDPCADHPGWCQAHPPALRVEDQLAAIGDLTYEAYRRDWWAVPFYGYGSGAAVPLVVLREGRRETVQWTMPNPTAAYRALNLRGVLFYLPFWLAGTVVLLFLRPRDARWWLLVVFNYLISLWLAAGAVSATHIGGSVPVTHAVSWLLAPVCLHLHLALPTPLFGRRVRRAIPFLYALCALCALLGFARFLPGAWAYAALCLAIAVSLGMLLHRCFARTTPRARATARLMLAGIGLALIPGLALGIVPSLLDPTAPGQMAIAMALAVVPILPLSYTYAIFKHQLGPLEFRANRVLGMYGFVLLCGTLFALVFLAGSTRFNLSGGALAFSLGLSAVFVVAASALYLPFRRLVDRLAYGATYDPDEIVRAFAKEIPAALDLDALAQLLAGRVAPSLLVGQSALCLLEGEGIRLVYTGGIEAEAAPQTPEDLRQLAIDGGRYRPAEGLDLGRSRLDWVRLSVPLALQDRLIGVWLFGRRAPDDYYPRDDIALLSTLGDQVTVALENIRLYEQAQREIAERKQAEVALRQERDRAQRYLDVAGVILVVLDLQGKIVMLNRRGHEILGYEQGELTGQSWFDVCLPLRERDSIWRVFEQILAGEVDLVEYHRSPVLTQSGQERIVAWHNAVLWDDAGTMAAVLSSGEDITERVRAEEARMRLIAAVEQTNEGIVILDDEARIQYVNPAFQGITGYAAEEVIGEQAWMIGSAADSGLYRALQQRLARDAAWTGRLHGQKKDGSTYEVEVSISPARDASSQATEYVIIQRDVTQQVAMEAQLRQAAKMEAIGQLAGGVAHDFNNILTAIQGYLEFVLSGVSSNDPKDWPSGQELRADLGEAKRAAERAAQLTHQLLAFSRKQILQPHVLDLNDLIADFEKMLRRLIGEDIKLVTSLAPELGKVRADRGQIEQVILNMIVNARDAMPHGGQLILETANVVLDEAYVRGLVDVRQGDYVRLAVSDTGVGMSEEVKSRIFEPFFTTKETGRGTGLGLATVYGIVKQSEGHISVYSELGMGTTFKIYLPRLEIEPSLNEPEQRSEAMPPGAETILLVEDDVTVRAMASRTLVRCGYAVLQAGHPAEALRLVQKQSTVVHLMVTDVVMPEMSGRDLAEQVLVWQPQIKVLYMSGYTDNAIVHHGVLDPGTAFLSKPFQPLVLARKVREVLDEDNKGNGGNQWK